MLQFPVRSRVRSGFVLAWAPLLLLLGALSPAPAAVRFDAFLGYDGVLPQANWFPVVCEVQNDGPSFNALVEVSSTQFGPGQRRAMAVELPTGTTKRFAIPVFAAGRGFSTWDARLLDERGRVRAEARNLRVRRVVAPRIPIFAAVSRTVPTLPEMKGDQSETVPVVARLQTAVFPDSPLGLQGLDTIYLSSERALELKVAQVNALQTWLRAGGRLIVGVEQLVYLNGNDWLRQLLPCEVTALGQVSDHSALQDWLTKPPRSGRLTPQIFRAQRSPMGAGVPGSPSDNPYGNLGLDTKFESMPMEVASVALRGGRVLIGSGTQPLAITGRRGRGEVIVLLFSPELEPFLSWANRPYFWARIADFPPELLVRPSGGNNYGNWGGLSLDGVFGAMIDSRQVRKLPVGWLLVLLLAYLVVIGPLDQWWLKKINRQMWTWITFPAYVALFSVLIYFIGYKLRAGETEYNELHLVDILPAGDQAEWHGSTYASLYSPANARYALVSDVPFSSLRGEYMGGWGSGNEASRASVEQRPAGFAAEVSVPVWTSQLFVGDWWRRGEAPLKVSLVPQGNGWQVEVENRTDQTISNAKLVIAQRLFNLGALPARRTSQFSTTKLASEDLSGFLQRQIGSFQSAAQQRRQAFSTGQGAFITDAASGAMAASFTSLLRPQDGYSQFISPGSVDLVPLLERGDAILLAWVPNWTPVKPMNRFSPRRSHRDTLLRVAVEPRPSLAEAIR